MHTSFRTHSFRIRFPFEQTPKREMLHDRKLAQHLRSPHLDHALIDLRPAVFDTRDVVENGRVFPEGATFDIVDELDSAEVHV